MIKKILLNILFILCTFSNVFADKLAIKDGKIILVDDIIEPKIVFVAPNEISPFMIIDARLENTGDFPVTAEYDWKVYQDSVESPIIIDKSEHKIAFGGNIRAQKASVELSVKLKYKLDDGEFVYNVNGNTIIENHFPAPPKPNPNPIPHNIPELSRLAIDNFETLVVSANPEYDRNILVRSANLQANNYIKASNEIINKQVRYVLSDIKNNNNKINIELGINDIVWDAWGEKLTDKLWALYNTNQLGTKEQYQKVFEDIAKGLELIK